MAKGRKPTTICNGCGEETETGTFWKHVHTSTISGSVSLDVIIPDEDYCPKCWKIICEALQKARRG